MSRGLSRRHLTPFLCTQCTPFFHLPCFLQNHLIGGVLISEVRFSSGLLRFALLTSTAQDYLPKSKQNGLTLSRKRRLGRLHYQQICAHAGSVGGGWALQSFSARPRTDPHSWPQKIHPSYLGVDEYGTVSKNTVYKIRVYVYIFICIWIFLKAHLVNADC